MRPIPADEFSRLIGSIYDCALDPALWPDTLGAICRAMDFSNAVLALQETPTWRLLLDVNVGLAQQDLERMRSFGVEVIDQWGGAERVMSLPLEVPNVLTLVNPTAHESRFAREWAIPLGLIDTLAIGFFRDQESLSSLAFGRHRDAGPITEAEIAASTLFIPHFKRALTISRLLDARAVERATFAAVLDGLAFGVLLVARDLKLLHANRAGEAMLRAADPLGIRNGRIVAPNGLSAALQAALAAPLDGIGRRGLGIPTRRIDGEELVLHLLPLADANPLPGAAAALFVAPATTPRPAPLDAIAALFDLTPAETRVLELLGAGRTNAEIAEGLGIAVSTVRTHVLRLFEKTATHRQAELVALLASFTLPLA
ncbi:MAG: helix-turn-helix transcriptional regulator [Amaricoccus sp.]